MMRCVNVSLQMFAIHFELMILVSFEWMICNQKREKKSSNRKKPLCLSWLSKRLALKNCLDNKSENAIKEKQWRNGRFHVKREHRLACGIGECLKRQEKKKKRFYIVTKFPHVIMNDE